MGVSGSCLFRAAKYTKHAKKRALCSTLTFVFFAVAKFMYERKQAGDTVATLVT